VKHHLGLLQVGLLVLLLSRLAGCRQKNNGLAVQTENKNQLSVVTSLDLYGETARTVLGNKGESYRGDQQFWD
jgi:ABC-type Zn uptake system ZnuABC Zn-binding protein ZnuA